MNNLIGSSRVNIQIDGFTDRQRELADHIWGMDSPEQLVEFFKILPEDLLHDAYVVYHMVIWACLDLDPCDDLSTAMTVINSIKNRPNTA